jgi:hypothetical protein
VRNKMSTDEGCNFLRLVFDTAAVQYSLSN